MTCTRPGCSPRRSSTFGHDLFLADVALGDVLDRDPRLRRQRCRPLAHAVAQRRGKLRVVEDAHLDSRRETASSPRRSTPWEASRSPPPGRNRTAPRQSDRRSAPRAIPSSGSRQLCHRRTMLPPLWFRLRRLRRSTLFLPHAGREDRSKLVMVRVRWFIQVTRAASLCSIGNDHPFVPTCLPAERRAQRQSRMPPRTAAAPAEPARSVLDRASTVLG